MPRKILLNENIKLKCRLFIIKYVHYFHQLHLNIFSAQSLKPSTRRKKGIELGDIQNSIESIKQTQEEIKR